MTENAHEKFADLLEHFDTAMFVTQTPEGQLRSRPMAIAQQSEEGDLQFITSDEAGKIDELLRNPRINIALQSANKFLSISGTAAISRDRAQLNKLWNPAMKVWFPEGKDDPNMILLRVQAEDGEYWDISFANKLKLLFKAGKALLHSEALDRYEDPDMHDKVNLR